MLGKLVNSQPKQLILTLRHLPKTIPLKGGGSLRKIGFRGLEHVPMTIQDEERQRIAMFLRCVYESSTHGASSLMERAIRAIEANDMSDPERIAAGYRGPLHYVDSEWALPDIDFEISLPVSSASS